MSTDYFGIAGASGQIAACDTFQLPTGERGSHGRLAAARVRQLRGAQSRCAFARASRGEQAAPRSDLGRANADDLRSMRRGFSAAPARARLDRWPRHRNRISLGGRRMTVCRVRGRICRRKVDVIVTAGTAATMSRQESDVDNPDRFCFAPETRSGPAWSPAGAPGRQCHRSIEHAADLAARDLNCCVKSYLLSIEWLSLAMSIARSSVLEMERGPGGGGRELGLDAFRLEVMQGGGYHPEHRSGQRRCRCAVCLQRSSSPRSGFASTRWRQRQIANHACISRACSSWGPDVLRPNFPALFRRSGDYVDRFFAARSPPTSPSSSRSSSIWSS